MSPLRRPLPRLHALALSGALLCAALVGCGGSDDSVDMAADQGNSPVADLSPPAARHNIHGTVALMDDGQGVGVFAQNGVFAHIPKATIVGKKTVWVILKGGEQVANGKMLEVGSGVVDDQLRFDFTTQLGYVDGPYELSLLIMLVSTDLAKAPQPGDLASFDLTKPPAGEPPVTGTSVRVRLHGADTAVTLVNKHFIKL